MINNIWLLIAKKLNNEASEEEQEELQRLLENDTEGKYPVDILNRLNNVKIEDDVTNNPSPAKWNLLKARLLAIDEETESKFDTNVKESASHDFVKRFVLLIAACLTIFCTFFLIKTKKSKPSLEVTQITSPTGAITNIELPDGSKVTLNSGSKIYYNGAFGKEKREVTLKGEALFDVTHNAAKPFIVTTSTVKIRVLGTKFNVKSYVEDNVTEAALLRGSIELTVLNNPYRQLLMVPGEKVKVFANNHPAAQTSGPANLKCSPVVELENIHYDKNGTKADDVLWTENEIVFDGLSFEDVAKMIERKYNVSLRFNNSQVKSIRLTGRFGNIPIDNVMRQLQVIGHFNYVLENNTVLIK